MTLKSKLQLHKFVFDIFTMHKDNVPVVTSSSISSLVAITNILFVTNYHNVQLMLSPTLSSMLKAQSRCLWFSIVAYQCHCVFLSGALAVPIDIEYRIYGEQKAQFDYGKRCCA